MTTGIAPSIDAYGNYARPSALADWLELAAISGRRVTRAQLEDLISDNGWTSLRPQQFVTLPDESNADSEDELTSDIPEIWSSAVLAVLQERQEVLKDKWPFEIRGNWQVFQAETFHTSSPYLMLLATTVAHAWKLQVSSKPTALIEATVARALGAKGLSVAMLGTADRDGKSFQTNLDDSAQQLGLRSQSPAHPAKARAKDAGVDTIALTGWRDDNRPAGNWISIGQVTITKSQNWERKLSEPRGDHWSRYLMEPLRPIRFLAVPHHVESPHLAHLVGPETGAVIDRLRLALDLATITDEEQGLVDEVLSHSVDDGRSVA